MLEESFWIQYLLPVALILGVMEGILGLSWVPFYVRTGIPISIERFSIRKKENFEDVLLKLIDEGLIGTWYPSLEFMTLSDKELAFRNVLLETKKDWFFRLPIRGFIRLNSSNEVSIKGFLLSPIFILLFMGLQFNNNL